MFDLLLDAVLVVGPSTVAWVAGRGDAEAWTCDVHRAREDLRRGGTAAVQDRRVGRGEVGEHQLSHPVLRRDPSGALVLQRGGAVLQLGLRSFMGSEGNDWGPMMATACL